MKAILADPPGGIEALRLVDIEVPQPKAGEVLIKVAATGVNRPDLLQRQGKYEPPPGATPVLGLEVAGEVAALGAGVQRWKRGDKVCALLAGGGYAEYAVASEGQCLPVPANMDVLHAALLPEGIFTVWANLFEAGQLRPGETALIHGGASGIGTFAIQMAIAFGAHAMVTVGNEEKRHVCLKLGAQLAVNYHTEDFVPAVFKATDGKGVNVVLDMVGGDYVPRNLDVLASLGRHVSIATQHGRSAEVDLRKMMTQRLTLTGSTLRPRSPTEKARLAREVERYVWPHVASGAIKPLLFRVFPLSEAAEAHKVMESGAHVGKLALMLAKEAI